MTIAELTFSLVVNTTDRSGPLRALLRSLEHQSYPHFEVVVVVGPTHDNTLEMLSEYEGRVRVLRCPTANLSRSRNIGLLASRGEIVAFIDDDAVPSRRWLEQLVRLFADPRLDATGGVVHLIHPNDPRVHHRIGIISSLAEQVDVRGSWLEGLVPPGEASQWIARMMGTNMAYRREALLAIGGFDEFFEWVYDETDVALRLTNAGRIVYPVEQAAVYHIPGSSRNRVAFTYTGKWWIQTKASVYFAVKNGTAGGESPRAIARRCLHLVHGHWLWSTQLLRDKRLTRTQVIDMRAQEVKAALIGATYGLRPRKLIEPSAIMPEVKAPQPIQLFQTSESISQASVDPIDGYRPAISLIDPPLRICLLSSAYPPAQFEGVGRHTNLMARGLFECGHTVHVITRGERNRLSFYDGAYVHELAVRLERYRAYRKHPNLFYALNHSHAVYEHVKRLMLNDGVQLVDSPVWQLDGLVTALSGIVPVVVRAQTAVRQIAAIQQNRDDDARLIGEMELALIKRAAYLVPNSQATVRMLEKVYDGVTGDKRYTVVPHGIVPVPDEDIRPFNLAQRARRSDAFTVLYVGRLEKRKGIMDLFRAIPLVLKQVPHAKFIIAGGDNSQHDGFKNQTGSDYPNYFAGHYRKLLPYVSFMGAVSEDHLRQLYRSCDLFVAPSLYESFGLIYLEAMNYAKPVVGCQAGGIPEVVEHGVTGLLVEPEAPLALAEAITTLLRSPTKLHTMGMAGRQRLLDNFTHIQMAQAFARVYRAVIHAAADVGSGVQLLNQR